MADEGNVISDINLGNGDDNAPAAGIISQYVKDLSVENPNAPQSFSWQNQPQVDIQFNIGARPIDGEVHEVELKITVAAKADEGTAYVVDLSYCGLVGMPPSFTPKRRASCSPSPAAWWPMPCATPAIRR